MDNISNLYVYQHGSFAKFLKFESLLVFLVIVGSLTLFFQNNYGFVILLLAFAIYLTNVYIGIRENTVLDSNKITMIKLQRIQKKISQIVQDDIVNIHDDYGITLDVRDIKDIEKRALMNYLYIDANLIHFIESILPLADYNELEFFTFVNGVNNILRLRYETEIFVSENDLPPDNIAQMLQIAMNLKTNTLNNLHNFIYSIPKTNVMYKYLDISLARYNVLISRNLDIIHEFYKKSLSTRGLNANTQIVAYSTIKPFDPQQKQFFN